MISFRSKITLAIFFTLFLNCISVQLITNSTLQVSDKGSATISLELFDKSDSEEQAFTQFINLEGNSHSSINIVNIPKEVKFIIIQVHSYLYNVSLSYDQSLFKLGNTVTGTNVGLFYENIGTTTTVVYLTNSNPIAVQCMIAVVAYSTLGMAPYPGGCNMEFDIEKSPFQKVIYDKDTITVDAQPASVPKIGVLEPRCEKYPLRHDAYRVYLPEQDLSNETYFNAISSMLTVRDIRNNAYKVPSPLFGSPMRRIYSAYPGVGSVFGMVAHFANYTSAYVPIVTYGCDPLSSNISCTDPNTTYTNFLCAIVFFLGVFVAMRGFYFFKTSMFLVGMMMGGVSGYTLAESMQHSITLDSTGILTMAVLAGILTSLLWLLCWVTISSAIPSLILSGITLGSFFFFAFYYFIPGGIFYLEFDAYFWMLFVLFIMLTILMFSAIPIAGNIFSFTILGAFATVFAIDYYNGSNLKYIIINGIRRATVPNFNIAVIDPPFQERDILLTVFMIFVVILGLCKQYAYSLERAPFPPSPFIRDERTPLLVQGNTFRQRQKSFFMRGHRRYVEI